MEVDVLQPTEVCNYLVDQTVSLFFLVQFRSKVILIIMFQQRHFVNEIIQSQTKLQSVACLDEQNECFNSFLSAGEIAEPDPYVSRKNHSNVGDNGVVDSHKNHSNVVVKEVADNHENYSIVGDKCGTGNSHSNVGAGDVADRRENHSNAGAKEVAVSHENHSNVCDNGVVDSRKNHSVVAAKEVSQFSRFNHYIQG